MSLRIVAALGLFAAAGAWADDAAPASSSTQSNATPAATPSAPAPKVICFQNSIRCFTAKPSKSSTLDLRAPVITRVFSEAELQQKLGEPEEIHEQAAVQVQGKREIAPVSVGLMAIPWAVIHPTQAWRIFMPLPEAK